MKINRTIRLTSLLLIVQFLLMISVCQNAYAQSPLNWTSADIHLALRKLNVLGSVLYLAAHPDDENTRLIAYFSKDKLYRTGYLSITRGDGGQNLIGDEQGIELGLIRTQELLSARRIDGGEQFFTRAFDFGYSKSPEETFSKWDKEKILGDVVWVIRKFQPDVIITRFPTTGEGGHGQHTASAILANEAFNAAADPNRFPEQLKYVQPWQPKRILWNTFNFGGTNTVTPDQFRVDVGGYNPLLGKSYGEIAAESRSQHKSQGFGVPSSRGESFESFKTMAGLAPVNDLMDDVNLGWKRVPGGESIEKLVDGIVASYDLLHPEKSVEPLISLYKAIGNLPDGYWKAQKLNEVKTLIEQCSGLFIDATSPEQFAVQTDSIRVNLAINNRLGANAVLQRITVDNFDTTLSKPLDRNKNVTLSKVFYVNSSKPVTQPYWLKEKMEEGYYHVADLKKIGQPDADPAYQVQIDIKIYGELFTFSRPVKYKFTDPVKGELYNPVVVIPVVTFNDFDKVYIKGDKSKSLDISFVANSGVSIPSPAVVSQTFSSTLDTLPRLIGGFSLQKKQMHTETWSDAELNSKNYRINVAPDYRNAGFILKTIRYDHIPAISYFKEAFLKVEEVDTRIYNKNIGYIIGADDKVPEALEQMGYNVTLLTEKELSRNNLKQFDAIISGVRAYNTNEWLNKYYDRLMKYVYDGGNYIVQYNTVNFVSNLKSKIGPYNFEISRTRITDENAPVQFLKPNHPALNFPNKISQDDFKGWVQERSIYHAGVRDSVNFETVISLTDPGEKAEDGSLIIAKYGKGYFTYTGLVFFRQLPAGVPGAYRLIANLIALNRKKAF